MINKKILIIGGTGALGQALTKKYLKNNEIIIFSRDEHKHVELSRKLPDVKFHIGDVKEKDSMLDPYDILKQLGEKGITSVLIEGGKRVHKSFFNAISRVSLIASSLHTPPVGLEGELIIIPFV